MTDELPRRIEYRPLSEVLPADRNPKEHDDAAIQASFQRHGFTEPVFEDGRTGKLVAGHGRLENLVLLHEAGHAMPEGIVAADDGEWMLPVVVGWSSADDAEAEDYVSVSNRLVELGGWNPQLLAEMYADPDRDISVCLMTTGKPLLTWKAAYWWNVVRTIANHCPPATKARAST